MTGLVQQWDLDPVAGFSDFVGSVEFVKTSSRIVPENRLKPVSKESADIYKLMFGKYARWLAESRTPFSRATHYDLLKFIEMGTVVDGQHIPDLNSKISYKYLRLIERCYLHLQVYPNPAQHVIFNAFKQQRYYSDKAMVTLTPEQRALFIAALPSSTLPTQWRQRRDRALQLVMLCGGLKVSEVIGLLLSEVSRQAEFDGTLEIKLTPEQKRATTYDHSTYLQAEAVPVLLDWVAEREALPIAGELVFPSHSGARQDKAKIYRQVKRTLVAAGIEIPRSGGRTLRNTFAIQEIRSGTDTPVLTQKLGLALERSTETYVLAEKSSENPTDQ